MATVPAIAFCRQCDRETPTELMQLRCGHTGNACRVCGALRRGRPYVSRFAVLSTPLPAPQCAAQGETNVSTSR